jgi:hypothetical protein
LFPNITYNFVSLRAKGPFGGVLTYLGQFLSGKRIVYLLNPMQAEEK